MGNCKFNVGDEVTFTLVRKRAESVQMSSVEGTVEKVIDVNHVLIKSINNRRHTCHVNGVRKIDEPSALTEFCRSYLKETGESV